jgi:hypothetical protein
MLGVTMNRDLIHRELYVGQLCVFEMHIPHVYGKYENVFFNKNRHLVILLLQPQKTIWAIITGFVISVHKRVGE